MASGSRARSRWRTHTLASVSRLWAALAVVVVAAGILGSIFGSRTIANRHALDSRRALAETGDQISTDLIRTLQQEDDATASMSAFVALNPDISERQLVSWVTAARMHTRYPEIGTVALVKIVPQAQLRAFERHTTGPTHPTGAGASKIFPPGRRPFYCLASVGLGWGRFSTPPTVWYDACALPGVRNLTLDARDTGRASYVATPYRGVTVLEADSPVYEGGGIPKTLAARRARFIGVLGETLLPNVILQRTLVGHPDTALTLSYATHNYHAKFHYGHTPPGAGSVVDPLTGGWTATITGPVSTASISGDATALAVLLGGILFSITLGALLWVLASGRARAQRLVREKTTELEHLATHDSLTGLPNRVLALDRADHALARSQRTGRAVVAMYVDIDGFKNINDTLGHAAGDALLEQVADRLHTVIREGDTAARLSGDEFLILLDGETHNGQPEVIAERLLDVLNEPYALGGEVPRDVTVTASIGIAHARDGGAEQLIADADFAMYAAKNEGKNRYVSFESEMQKAVHEQLALQLDLFEAVDQDQLFLVYQPIFGLGAEEVIGVEALVRWRHPTRGVLPPAEFIPLAERTGQISALGRWVLSEACARAAQWRSEGHQLTISVNISGRQLDDDTLITDVRAILAETDLEPSALMLEITETALMNDPGAAAERLTAIKAIGVKLAIDDFGTGYSSLAYLRQFSVDALKIDRSFVNAISTSTQAAAVTHTLIQLGKKLGLETLAEGIEDSSQLQYLRTEHCDLGQGFLLAHPVEEEELEALLRQRSGRSDTGSAVA